ncbi:MAG TPA: adenylate/guanylate cyclase domain-containing protein [Anaerolineales bacterium]|jgi:adenylate cyclase|nr:adenylate/guanylate cyclase domain-containing protein [Anaerolineales bacterium]
MVVNKDNVEQMWHDWFMTDAFAVEMRLYRFFNILPHDPRCKLCHAPFQGVGGMVVGALYGRKQSNLNPYFCNVCEDFAKKFPGGAEVEMSMLFVDVRGSTALSEQMTPLEFQKLINRFFIGTTKAIAEEDGLVEKLAGDAVAAFWGAGFAGKDYVARTVHAAQKILKVMEAQKIPVGIGVHAGVAYFGAMGSAEGLVNISAIGDEVNTAARIASKAAAGEILISEQALKAAGMDSNQLESRNLELKGISEQISVRVMQA